jgi:hypothetical protein
LLFLAAVLPMATIDLLVEGRQSIADIFYWEQDATVVVAMALLIQLLRFDFPQRWSAPIAKLSSNWWTVVVLSMAVGLVAYGGTFLVLENYPLSMDEFMASFDAQIFRHGRFAASVPSAWRQYLPALEPTLIMPVPRNIFWMSSYLPVNAALRALFNWLGSEQAAGPAWASLSTIAIYGIGTRLWPSRRDLALVATLLLLTSSQFVITAMTPYAMPTHLALNLTWLWLILTGGRLAHALAIVVAFLACGLHQLVFNLLFAAPFVLQLWLDRRWTPALVHTLAYAAISLFWIFYWTLLFRLIGVAGSNAASVAGVAPASGNALAQFIGHIAHLVGTFNISALPLMAENLTRFASWQNILTTPLLLLAARSALTAAAPLRNLLLGLVLTVLLVTVVIPFQDHGWGYRYLHGLLGSTCLLAAWLWGRLTDGLAAADQDKARGILTFAIMASAVLIPVGAWQANRFTHPYAEAQRAIQAARADVVLVDSRGVLYGMDLVRNDPWLQRGPMVLELNLLDPIQIHTLCRTKKVSVFSGPTALSYGIRPLHSLAGKKYDIPVSQLTAAQVCRD